MRANLILDRAACEEQHLVFRLQHIIGFRQDDPVVADHDCQRGVIRQRDVTDALTDHRVVGRQLQFGQADLALSQLHEADQMPDVDRTLYRGDERAWRGYRDVDTPGLGEQPFVAGIVDPRHHPVDTEFGFGQQRGREVDLVVAGRRDHHIAQLHSGFLERGELARVGQQPIRTGNGLRFVMTDVVLDQ